MQHNKVVVCLVRSQHRNLNQLRLLLLAQPDNLQLQATFLARQAVYLATATIQHKLGLRALRTSLISSRHNHRWGPHPPHLQQAPKHPKHPKHPLSVLVNQQLARHHRYRPQVNPAAFNHRQASQLRHCSAGVSQRPVSQLHRYLGAISQQQAKLRRVFSLNRLRLRQVPQLTSPPSLSRVRVQLPALKLLLLLLLLLQRFRPILM